MQRKIYIYVTHEYASNITLPKSGLDYGGSMCDNNLVGREKKLSKAMAVVLFRFCRNNTIVPIIAISFEKKCRPHSSMRYTLQWSVATWNGRERRSTTEYTHRYRWHYTYITYVCRNKGESHNTNNRPMMGKLWKNRFKLVQPMGERGRSERWGAGSKINSSSLSDILVILVRWHGEFGACVGFC